jgi:hypothetical protein
VGVDEERSLVQRARTFNPVYPKWEYPSLPAGVRNWLVARYLSDPTPGPALRDDPEPIVFVPFDTFADYLVSAGCELMPNLDIWKNAGWIEDVMAVIPPSLEPNDALPYYFVRLSLPPGRHRLVGIRRAVLNTPTDTTAEKRAPQTDTGERAPDDRSQDVEQPHHRQATATSGANTDRSATENGKPDSKGPPSGPFDDLRDASQALKLKGKMATVVRLLCERAGCVPLADLALECEWATTADENSAVYVNSWNSLRCDLNKKLKKHGWRLVQHDLCAVAERLKPSAGK